MKNSMLLLIFLEATKVFGASLTEVRVFNTDDPATSRKFTTCSPCLLKYNRCTMEFYQGDKIWWECRYDRVNERDSWLETYYGRSYDQDSASEIASDKCYGRCRFAGCFIEEYHGTLTLQSSVSC